MLGVEHHDAELLDSGDAVLRQQIAWPAGAASSAAAVRRSRARACGAPARPRRCICAARAGRRPATRAQPIERPAASTRARPPARSISRLASASASRRASRCRGPPRAVRCRRAPARPSRSSFSRGRSCGATSFINAILRSLCVSGGRRRVLACLAVAALSVACACTPEQGDGSGPGRDRCRARRRRRSVRNDRVHRRDRRAQERQRRRRRQGDYRLALNYALESREQAQNAARGAADTKAPRPRRSRALHHGNHRPDRAGQRVRLTAGGRTRAASPGVSCSSRAPISRGEADVQKAGEAVAMTLAAETMSGGVRTLLTRDRAISDMAPRARRGDAVRQSRHDVDADLRDARKYGRS